MTLAWDETGSPWRAQGPATAAPPRWLLREVSQFLLLAVAFDDDLDLFAGLKAAEDVEPLGSVLDRLARNLHDPVAFLQPGLRRGAAVPNATHQRARFVVGARRGNPRGRRPRGGGRGVELDLHLLLLALALEDDLRLVTPLEAGQGGPEAGQSFDRLAADGLDPVAGLQSRLRRRRVLDHRADQRPGLPLLRRDLDPECHRRRGSRGPHAPGEAETAGAAEPTAEGPEGDLALERLAEHGL